MDRSASVAVAARTIYVTEVDRRRLLGLGDVRGRLACPARAQIRRIERPLQGEVRLGPGQDLSIAVRHGASFSRTVLSGPPLGNPRGGHRQRPNRSASRANAAANSGGPTTCRSASNRPNAAASDTHDHDPAV